MAESVNEFLSAIQAKYPHYIQILADNENESILAVPPTGFFKSRSITIDADLISEHVLQFTSVDGQEMTSLSGKTYQMKGDRKLKLVDQAGASGKKAKIQVTVRSRDSYFAGEDKSFKRILISNCLDQRYFDQLESQKQGTGARQ